MTKYHHDVGLDLHPAAQFGDITVDGDPLVRNQLLADTPGAEAKLR